MKNRFSHLAGLLAAAITLTGSLALYAPSSRAQTSPLLEQQGVLEPAIDEYPIDLATGDVITIRMNSEDFDTLLILLGPDGEEVAFNDDSEGSLNSRIVYTAQEAGQYTIVARSYAGNGGNYQLRVAPATAYEVSLSQAQLSLQEGNYEAAIAALTEAISLNPDGAEAYLARVDAYFGMVYTEMEAQGQFFEGPDDIPAAYRTAIVDDFLAAAAIYEAEGDAFSAQSLREQAEYIRTGEFPEPSPVPEG
jgi:tetratricopeptide (TPR) repeat protein